MPDTPMPATPEAGTNGQHPGPWRGDDGGDARRRQVLPDDAERGAGTRTELINIERSGRWNWSRKLWMYGR